MRQIYLRPCAFIETPIGFDGQAARLAGTMVYFSAVEVIETAGGKRASKAFVSVKDLDTHLSSLPTELAVKARSQFANITSPRPALRMGTRNILLDQPRVMGILNCTPDSFSDGGKLGDNPEALAQIGGDMAAAGAAIIDVGGESTRPGAPLVWEGDEIKQVQPVVERLANAGHAVSIDTRKAAVMEAALQSGAMMINDISALLFDDRSLEVAKVSDCPIVLMHAPSQSSDPHKSDGYHDVLFDVFDWLEERVEALVAAGISRERLLVDPGIGFGKSLSDNLTLVNNLSLFHGIGCPVLFGASRKRMIGALSNEAHADARLGGSIFLAMKAVEQGAHIVRVHDVPETVQAIHVWRGLRDAALTAG
ncbi:dihydropteroate synthase [Sphingorhabdus sp.]|uniref:dihydropteroate synthase n=1 Tax=Sphingorhabdus sp. TaxID=1902408 RepID=UPI003CC5F4C4